MEFERFAVNLVGDKLSISAQEDQTYIIYNKGGERIGVISPYWKGDELVWVPSEGITEDYARQIGELIQEHDM